MNGINQIIIFCITAIILSLGLTQTYLFDWDEINFAEIAREMIVTNDYFNTKIGFDSFYEKPPLFIWLQVCCFKLFGINEFAARFPNVIVAGLTLVLLYRRGVKAHNHYFGVFWVLSYFSCLFIVYYTSAIIDPWFNYFILFSVFQLMDGIHFNKLNINGNIHFLVSGIFLGLAVITKGQVAILLVGIFLLIQLVKSEITLGKLLKACFPFLLGFLCIIGFFVLPFLIKGDFTWLVEFTKYQLVLVKGQIEWHNQPWFYHPLVLLLVGFPCSILAIRFLFTFNNLKNTNLDKVMLQLFWIVLILFSIVTTKIVHYSSLCWFGLSYGAAKYMFIKNKSSYFKIPIVGLVIGILLCLVLIALFVGFLLVNFKLIPITLIKNLVNDSFFNLQLSSYNLHLTIFEIILIAFVILNLFIVIIGIFKASKNGIWRFMVLSGISLSLCIMFVILPKVQTLTQTAYINKTKELYGKKHIQFSYDFKSFTPYFYGKIKPEALALKLANGTITKKDSKTNYKDWCLMLCNYPINKSVSCWSKEKQPIELLKLGFLPKGLFNGYYLHEKVVKNINNNLLN